MSVDMLHVSLRHHFYVKGLAQAKSLVFATIHTHPGNLTVDVIDVETVNIRSLGSK